MHVLQREDRVEHGEGIAPEVRRVADQVVGERVVFTDDAGVGRRREAERHVPERDGAKEAEPRPQPTVRGADVADRDDLDPCLLFRTQVGQRDLLQADDPAALGVAEQDDRPAVGVGQQRPQLTVEVGHPLANRFVPRIAGQSRAPVANRDGPERCRVVDAVQVAVVGHGAWRRSHEAVARLLHVVVDDVCVGCAGAGHDQRDGRRRGQADGGHHRRHHAEEGGTQQPDNKQEDDPHGFTHG